MGIRASMGAQASVAGYDVKMALQNYLGGHLNIIRCFNKGYNIGFYN